MCRFRDVVWCVLALRVSLGWVRTYFPDRRFARDVRYFVLNFRRPSNMVFLYR